MAKDIWYASHPNVPYPGRDGEGYSFGYGFISSLEAYSVWATSFVAWFATIKTFYLFRNKVWKNYLTWEVITLIMNLVAMALFGIGGSLTALLGQADGIVFARSLIGHYILPIILLLYFFIVIHDKQDYKIQFKKHSYKIMLIVLIYATIIITKYLVTTNFERDEDAMYEISQHIHDWTWQSDYWLYPAIAPFNLGWYLFSFTLIVIIFAHMGVYMFFIFINNQLKYRFK
ncbi:hypothetical protein [Mesoplasma photuris]|uniref:hypothetical protein n=1 Tax=Mesoplasma photuris TaxID=217731 RepID=UPI00146FAF5E|nr:hypothetical protein [Mesoplasma photuris]